MLNVHPQFYKYAVSCSYAIDSKECRTQKFLLQKLQYIHANPRSGKWKLADEPMHYEHSSAAFYISGKMGSYAIRDYEEVLVLLSDDIAEQSAAESSG